MAEVAREQKKKLGALLIKLKKQDFSITQDEWSLAKVLESRGLTKFLGPEPGPKITSMTDFVKNAQLAALSHYVLTGLGEEFALRYSESQLIAGQFLLPGEIPWHDRWPWKLLMPAIISVITTVITTFIISVIKG
jgi:hypothetical protein